MWVMQFEVGFGALAVEVGVVWVGVDGVLCCSGALGVPVWLPPHEASEKTNVNTRNMDTYFLIDPMNSPPFVSDKSGLTPPLGTTDVAQ